MYITGLPIDGKQISGFEPGDPIETIVNHLSLHPVEANDLLLPNKRGKKSHNISLKPVHATLKASMNKVRQGNKTLTGFAYLLMVFAFERFKCLREIFNFAIPSQFPLMLGWANETSEILRNRCLMPTMETCFDKLREMADEDLGLELGDLKKCDDFRIKMTLKERGPGKDKNWRDFTSFYRHCNTRWTKRNMHLIKKDFSMFGPLMNYLQEGDVDERETESPPRCNLPTPRDEVQAPSSTLLYRMKPYPSRRLRKSYMSPQSTVLHVCLCCPNWPQILLGTWIMLFRACVSVTLVVIYVLTRAYELMFIGDFRIYRFDAQTMIKVLSSQMSPQSTVFHSFFLGLIALFIFDELKFGWLGCDAHIVVAPGAACLPLLPQLASNSIRHLDYVI
ncbi:unnamed protein product [Vicia faba]|uniref:Uncharacterized protein n=1 Tax=Vicia faba TaxID=3906 RepID=A0AAV0ZI96_VICFA|nr:unnamed protein product [Vicia faba]